MTKLAKDNKLIAIIIGTICITFFTMTPLLNLINLFCFAGVALGSFLASVYYCSKARQNEVEIYIKDGVLIGLFSGILSSVVVVLISMFSTIISKTNPMIEISEMFNSFFKTVPNEINNVIQQLSDEYETLGYSPTLMLTMLVMNLLIYPVVGLVGGLLGVVLKRNSKKPDSNYLNT